LFEGVKRVFPWFVRVPFGLGSTLDSVVFASVDSDTEEITFEIPFNKQLLSLNEIIIDYFCNFFPFFSSFINDRR
jgi:hypothetical protein